MTRLLVLAVIVAAVLLLFRSLAPKPRVRLGPTTFPYRRRESLFSAAERSFLGVLDREVHGRYRVFGKVRLGDVLTVSGGLSAEARAAAFNRIAQKHVDFVLCRPSDLAIVAVIELDDQSHQRPDRQARDGFLAAACQAAGIELIRFPVKPSYTSAEVAEALQGFQRAAADPLRLEA